MCSKIKRSKVTDYAALIVYNLLIAYKGVLCIKFYYLIGRLDKNINKKTRSSTRLTICFLQDPGTHVAGQRESYDQ